MSVVDDTESNAGFEYGTIEGENQFYKSLWTPFSSFCSQNWTQVWEVDIVWCMKERF